MLASRIEVSTLQNDATTSAKIGPMIGIAVKNWPKELQTESTREVIALMISPVPAALPRLLTSRPAKHGHVHHIGNPAARR
jgi:hypothetical protein